MPKRQCLLCNQPAVDGGSRCSTHVRPSGWQRWQGAKKGAGTAYYSTAACQNRRRRQLGEYPTCAVCGERATQADHVKNIAAGGDRNGPLQSLCVDCHRRKTGQEGHRARYPKKKGT